MQYKLTSEPTTWTTAATETITGNSSSVIRKHYEYAVTPGEYDVRAKVTTARQTGITYLEKVYWEYIQEFVEDAFLYPYTALLGVKALATDQLNGTNPKVTALVTRGNLYLEYDSGTADAPSSNPAFACWDLLTNKIYGAGIPYTRLNISEFIAWANFCDDNSYKVNIYLEASSTLATCLAKIATCGRGCVIQRGTKFGVLYDGAADPVQLFTIGNIVADSFEESYLEKANRADVIEITILDEDNDYQRRTIEIARSTYDSSTDEIKMTQISLEGCTNWTQAAKYGKFLMNCQEYLMRTISFKTDVDAIACQPGDVISVQHDVPQWGYGGRVVSATANTITFDRPLSVLT
jgi:predicted phage tail protein